MTARRLSLTNKKVRGISRRLRAISQWAESFTGYFPEGLNKKEKYWNVKIPVLLTLVQGKQTTKEIQAYCAQSLILAAHKIFTEKPKDSSEIRVTCCIVLPDMFSSEICIYTDEDYFNEHTNNGNNRFGKLEEIKNNSLAKAWGLVIPHGFSEIGILRTTIDDDGSPYMSRPA